MVMADRLRLSAREGSRAWRRLERRVRGVLGDREFERHALVGPGRLWEAKRDWQIGFLVERGLLPAHRFLDIGCGTLRGGIPIIERLDQGHYTGIEVRPHVLEEAKAELARHPLALSKEPRLVLSEGFPTLGRLGPFDRAWGFSVLIHMTDAIAAECFQYVGQELNTGGVFYANVRMGDRADTTGAAGFPVVSRPLEFYRDLATRAGLETTDLGTLKSLGHDLGVRGDSHHLLQFSPSTTVP
jgi:SAM-dependent methyltransferase